MKNKIKLKIKILLLTINMFLQFDLISQIEPIEVKKNTSQSIEIGEAKMFGLFAASCEMKIDKKDSVNIDTSYSIFFRNLTYQHIVDIDMFTFSETGGDFEKLYNLIKTNIEKDTIVQYLIPMGKKDLTLNFVNGQVQFIIVYPKSKSYSYLLKLKQINKLFGKV